MKSIPMRFIRRITVALVLCAAILGVAPRPAQARIWVGVGVPFPGYGYYPPPYYYPPPVYYPPPPVVYARPPQVYSPAPYAAPASGTQSCYAGPYVCPMDRPIATGGTCYCSGNGGQRVWGKAN